MRFWHAKMKKGGFLALLITSEPNITIVIYYNSNWTFFFKKKEKKIFRRYASTFISSVYASSKTDNVEYIQYKLSLRKMNAIVQWRSNHLVFRFCFAEWVSNAHAYKASQFRKGAKNATKWEKNRPFRLTLDWYLKPLRRAATQSHLYISFRSCCVSHISRFYFVYFVICYLFYAVASIWASH